VNTVVKRTRWWTLPLIGAITALATLGVMPEQGAGAWAIAARASAVAACNAARISVTAVPGIPTMGADRELLRVRNFGPHTCALMGYPQVSAVGSGMFIAATPAKTGFGGGPPVGSSNSLVALQRGETATAMLWDSDRAFNDAPSCGTYSRLVLTLPGESGIRPAKAAFGGCGVLYVSPFVLGFNGTQVTGQVVGSVPRCANVPTHSGPGPYISISAHSGKTVAGAMDLFASDRVSERFALALPPGTYQLTSGDHERMRVDVHGGRIDEVGRFGSCTKPGPLPHWSGPTTIPLHPVPVSAPTCRANQLEVRYRGTQGGTGNYFSVFWVADTSPRPCELRSAVRVDLLDLQGVALRTAKLSITKPIRLSPKAVMPAPLSDPAAGERMAFVLLMWLGLPDAILAMGATGDRCPVTPFQPDWVQFTFSGVASIVVGQLRAGGTAVPSLCGPQLVSGEAESLS
jgi:uncharacterized protein DUF4232